MDETVAHTFVTSLPYVDGWLEVLECLVDAQHHEIAERWFYVSLNVKDPLYRATQSRTCQ